MDRAVPAFHGEAGFDDVAVLQHVVGDQYAVLIKDTQDFRQEVDVLSLAASIKIKSYGPSRVLRLLQRLRDQRDAVGEADFSKFSRAIGMRFRNFLLWYLCVRFAVLCHETAENPTAVPTSRILFGCFIFKNTLKALHFTANDRHFCLFGRPLQIFQKQVWPVSRN